MSHNLCSTLLKTVSLLCLIHATSSKAYAAVADYLDFELPDSSLSSTFNILENGKSYRREAYQDERSTVAIATTQHRDGNRALQITQTPSTGTGKDRMEWTWYDWKPGTAYWEGFSFYFDPAFQAPVNNDPILHQWKNQQAGYTAGLQLRPASTISDPLGLRIKLGYGATEAQRAYRTFDPVYTFQRGQWYDVIVNYKITCTGQPDSFFKVWVNGQMVLDFTGVIGIQEQISAIGGHKFGLYRSQQQSWMRVFHDSLRRGSSYAEVDPAGNTTSPSSGNLAYPGGVITSFSDQETGTEASKAIDGVADSDSNRWSAYSYPQWIEVDLGTNRNVSGTELITVAGRAYKFRVEAKVAGGSYATVVDRTANTTASPIANTLVAPVTARYVRITITGAHNYTGGWASIREFKILGN